MSQLYDPITKKSKPNPHTQPFTIPNEIWLAGEWCCNWNKIVTKKKQKKCKTTRLGQQDDMIYGSIQDYISATPKNPNKVIYKSTTPNIWVGVGMWHLMCVIKIKGTSLTVRKLYDALGKIAQYQLNPIEVCEYAYLVHRNPRQGMKHKTVSDLLNEHVINQILDKWVLDKQHIIVCNMDH